MLGHPSNPLRLGLRLDLRVCCLWIVVVNFEFNNDLEAIDSRIKAAFTLTVTSNDSTMAFRMYGYFCLQLLFGLWLDVRVHGFWIVVVTVEFSNDPEAIGPKIDATSTHDRTVQTIQ
uniref:Transmembrane protein n=1 Tax=Panagrellus redivivus TaxID=6233 RepID=A0A7E4UXZ4_PANRE